MGPTKRSEEAAPKGPPLDAPILPTNDEAVAIVRVIRPVDDFRRNIPGDRISLSPPTKAAWYAQKGFVAIEIATVKPSEIRAAGSVTKFLKDNPKKNKLSVRLASQIPPIAGLPSSKDIPPWEMMAEITD
jgi:hypothetical protein